MDNPKQVIRMLRALTIVSFTVGVVMCLLVLKMIEDLNL